MRGKDLCHPSLILFRRITPAYAGKSRQRLHQPLGCGDHPRVCGEKVPSFITRPLHTGSPPRMRGKVCPVLVWLLVVRITPAYAGKSNTSTMMWCSHWDHPRVCGEKFEAIFRNETLVGSPPRMRGKVQELPVVAAGAGITPAYAGKSSFLVSDILISQDHPRVCGEKTKKIP